MIGRYLQPTHLPAEGDSKPQPGVNSAVPNSTLTPYVPGTGTPSYDENKTKFCFCVTAAPSAATAPITAAQYTSRNAIHDVLDLILEYAAETAYVDFDKGPPKSRASPRYH